MHTKETLINDIKNIGIKSDDLLTIHISLKSVGEIDCSELTGAEVMIEALKSSVADGLLIIPAHTYKTMDEIGFFDIRNTVPCIGAVPCVAVEMANSAHDKGDNTVIRSGHPDHSVVAFGEKASEYVKEDASADSVMPMDGSYGKLITQNGKILLIGVDLTRNTFIHLIDQYMTQDIPLRYRPVTVVSYEGIKADKRLACIRGNSRTYEKYRPCLEESGAITYGKIGDADAILIEAKKCFDAITKAWHLLN